MSLWLQKYSTKDKLTPTTITDFAFEGFPEMYEQAGKKKLYLPQDFAGGQTIQSCGIHFPCLLCAFHHLQEKNSVINLIIV